MATQSTEHLVSYSLKERMTRFLDRVEKNVPVHHDEVAETVRVVRQLATSLKNGHPDDPQEYIRQMQDINDATIRLSKWLARNGYDQIELHPEYKTADQMQFLVLHEFYEHYFEVRRRISKGSWGHIYEVKSKKDGSNSAVQVMVEENAANLQDSDQAKREVCALAALSHPNVVKYHAAWIQFARVSQKPIDQDFGKCSSVKAIFYIQMELCKENLPAWLAERNRTLQECQKPDDQTVQNGLKIFRQVMEGVNYVHSNGIAHHDIQPHSILFGFDLVPKIGDFRFPGLSFQRPSRRGQVFSFGSPGPSSSPIAYTEEYMTYAMKEDIYDMGRILVELLCPFPSLEKLRDELGKIEKGQMHIMKAYPKNVRDLIFDMRNEDPSKRPTAKKVLGYAVY